ncbi:MAG: class I SAM-dependent methyltransferase [Pseudomonadota bacterium]
MDALYDTIGINYADLRRPDPRIGRLIDDALGSAVTVLNVGAGTGSYEPADRDVTAVDPSLEMLGKRPTDAARSVQAVAEALPFDDGSFDAAMAVLTVHHWSNKPAGLREVRRVTRGPIVLLTYDPAQRPWLTDYLPALAKLDEAQMPGMDAYGEWLGPVAVTPVPIPYDCSDGFLHAYWRRPGAYLDARLRTGISSFWKLDRLEAGLERLRQDIESGAWRQRYADLLELDAYDAGYRLVVSPGETTA